MLRERERDRERERESKHNKHRQNAYIVHAEQFLVLLTKSIFWFREHLQNNSKTQEILVDIPNRRI